MNGNRWVGTGHNTRVPGLGGQWWTIYHAVDQERPVLRRRTRLHQAAGRCSTRSTGSTAGRPSAAAVGLRHARCRPRPRSRASAPRYRPQLGRPQLPGRPARRRTPTSSTARARRRAGPGCGQPGAGAYGVADGVLRFDTQHADLYVDSNNASVLTRAGPARRLRRRDEGAPDVPGRGLLLQLRPGRAWSSTATTTPS